MGYNQQKPSAQRSGTRLAMVQPTAKELMDKVGKPAIWVLRHGDTTLRLKTYIADAKNVYGRTHYQCLIEGQLIWLDESSLEINP